MRNKINNNIKVISVLIFCFTILNCNSQNSELLNKECNDLIIISHDEKDGDYSTIELPKKIKGKYNWVTVNLGDKVPDNAHLFFNNEELNKTEGLNQNLFYKYDRDDLGVKLRVITPDASNCMEVIIDKKHNMVNINWNGEAWILEYSGYYEVIWK